MLIDANANVNARTHRGNTPLLEATETKTHNVMKTLIDAKADVNLKNEFGSTPLHIASKSDKFEKVRLLIDAKADVNEYSGSGQTPLLEAMQTTGLKIMETLIEKGADVNAADNHGITPLHSAVMIRNLDNVRLLIKKGANVNAQTISGETPVMKTNQPEIVKTLIHAKADLNIRDNQGRNALERIQPHSPFHTEIKDLLEKEMNWNERKALLRMVESIPGDDKIFRRDEKGRNTFINPASKPSYHVINYVTNPYMTEDIASYLGPSTRRGSPTRRGGRKRGSKTTRKSK
jgi:ankyrin repeat protein